MTGDVSATGTSSVVATTAPTPILTLAQLEKLYILDMLKKTGNNKTKTAELLGVSLKTIYNKLASYGAEGNV
jgi:DNA-binding NtrC family response regulator